MKSKVSFLFAALLIVPFLAYAGGSRETDSQKSGGPAVLRFALPGNPDTLDPHTTSGTLTFQVVKSFYDTLAEPDADGRIVPALAESWSVSEDGLRWTFRLRGGVVFHNGDSLTSADVKASFERLRDEQSGSAHFKDFAAVESIETPDISTVVFSLTSPQAPFLATLASGWSAVLPKSLIDSGHDFDSEPVGTGPFMFNEWVRDNRIVMEKNTGYWMNNLPLLDRIEMYVIPETSVQVQSLMSGQVDIVFIVDSDSVPMLEANPDVRLEENLTALIMVLAMNCESPYLSDLRVRRAVNHAVDKQKVLDIAYGGGETIDTFMDRSSAYYYDKKYYAYDPDKAAGLLREAGVPSDAEFRLILPQNYALHVQAGEMYQEMLSRVGLNVKIQLVDWSTWLSEVYSGRKYDFTVIGHTGKLDPNGTLTGYGEGKYVAWFNEEAASLIKKAAVTSRFEDRKPLYDRVLDIMAKEVPFVYLGSGYRTTGYRSDVSGFRITPKLDTFDFRWTEITR